jgi:hypothetical protein
LSYATNQELRLYPILHFAFENLNDDGKSLYRRACLGDVLDVREQLDAIWHSGFTAATQRQVEALEAEFNAGWDAGKAAEAERRG